MRVDQFEVRSVLGQGARPLHALASVLRNPSSSAEPTVEAVVAAGETEQTMRDHPGALNVRLHELAAATGSRVVLVVDQLEEVITQAVTDAAAFVAAISRAAVEADGPVQVIVTVRDDFLGRLGEFDSLGDALANVMVLGPPRRAQLRTILTLYRAERLDARTPGARDGDATVEVLPVEAPPTQGAKRWRVRIEARSGHAFLRTAVDSELHWIVKDNQRPSSAMNFGLGVRCAE